MIVDLRCNNADCGWLKARVYFRLVDGQKKR